MRIFFLIFVMVLVFAENVFANAKTQIEKVNSMSDKNFNRKFDLKLNKNEQKNESNIIYSSKMTNIEYDEANYHYDKFKKYINDNIKYSQSGKMKY